jgi:hypothetical protein
MPYFWKPSDQVPASTVLEVLLEAHAECGEDETYGIEYAVEKLYGVKMFNALAAGEEITDAHYADG